jgi:hypothetical protein
VKHYPVVNMLDAFEFLTLKSFEGRSEALKWEIWAYTHACLQRYWDRNGTWGLREGCPLSLASGLYGAWFHVGEEALSENDTEWLCLELDHAVEDARSLTEMGGGNLVIHDESCRKMNVSSTPHATRGEHVDEIAGLLIRGGYPLLSSSRILEREFAKNEQPLLVHHLADLPLDVLKDLEETEVALHIGPQEDCPLPGVSVYNPVETLDPLGDGRYLRTDVMPGEVADWVKHLSRTSGGPALRNPAAQCVHFHYWKHSAGHWRFLLGNIEVDAGDTVAEIVIPLAWASRQEIHEPSLLHTDTCTPPEVCEQSWVFRVPLPANTSCVCLLQDLQAIDSPS